MNEYVYFWDIVLKLVRKFDVGKLIFLRIIKVYFFEKILLLIKGNLFLF